MQRECEAMPLTPKGEKIKRAMKEQYGEEKGERVFYASENKGTIKGVAKSRAKKAQKRPTRRTRY
jgi:hypothetical protein